MFWKNLALVDIHESLCQTFSEKCQTVPLSKDFDRWSLFGLYFCLELSSKKDICWGFDYKYICLTEYEFRSWMGFRLGFRFSMDLIRSIGRGLELRLPGRESNSTKSKNGSLRPVCCKRKKSLSATCLNGSKVQKAAISSMRDLPSVRTDQGVC